MFGKNNEFQKQSFDYNVCKNTLKNFSLIFYFNKYFIALKGTFPLYYESFI